MTWKVPAWMAEQSDEIADLRARIAALTAERDACIVALVETGMGPAEGVTLPFMVQAVAQSRLDWIALAHGAAQERDAALTSQARWKTRARLLLAGVKEYRAQATINEIAYIMAAATRERFRDLLNQAHAERDNARDDAAGLRSKLTDIELAGRAEVNAAFGQEEY